MLGVINIGTLIPTLKGFFIPRYIAAKDYKEDTPYYIYIFWRYIANYLGAISGSLFAGIIVFLKQI